MLTCSFIAKFLIPLSNYNCFKIISFREIFSVEFYFNATYEYRGKLYQLSNYMNSFTKTLQKSIHTTCNDLQKCLP